MTSCPRIQRPLRHPVKLRQVTSPTTTVQTEPYSTITRRQTALASHRWELGWQRNQTLTNGYRLVTGNETIMCRPVLYQMVRYIVLGKNYYCTNYLNFDWFPNSWCITYSILFYTFWYIMYTGVLLNETLFWNKYHNHHNLYCFEYKWSNYGLKPFTNAARTRLVAKLVTIIWFLPFITTTNGYILLQLC